MLSVFASPSINTTPPIPSKVCDSSTLNSIYLRGKSNGQSVFLYSPLCHRLNSCFQTPRGDAGNHFCTFANAVIVSFFADKDFFIDKHPVNPALSGS